MGNSDFRVREIPAAAAFFVLVSYLLYWPVFNHLATQLFQPFAARVAVDVELLLWIQSTVANNLISAPLDLFGGLMFHPDPIPVARSEHLLSQQLTFAPIFLVTGNPVLAQQLSILANFAMCGLSFYLLLRHWRVSIPAAVLGGLIYTAFPARYFNVHAPHTSAVQYLPLTLLFVDRSLSTGRWRDGLLLAVSLTLQMLTSFYMAFVAAFFVSAYTLGNLLSRGLPPLRNLIVTGAGGAAGLGVLLLVALPYLELTATGGYPEHDTGSLVLMSNFSWTSYLYPPIAVLRWQWPRWGLGYYVGVIPLALALIGVASTSKRWKTLPVIGLLLATTVVYLLAMGPLTSPDAVFLGKPFQWASRWIPGFSVIRAPGRFGMGVLVGVAAFAGLGADTLFRALARRGTRTVIIAAITAVLALLTATEFGIFHFRYRAFSVPVGDDIPPVYGALRDLEPGPVLELPGGSLEPFVYDRAEARAAYYAIFHGHEVLNGYTGYTPSTYTLLMSIARTLPDPRAIDLLQKLAGLRYLILHDRLVQPFEKDLWRDPPGLHLIGKYGKDRLFRVPEEPSVLMSELLAPSDPSRTLLGNSSEKLSPAGMEMEILPWPELDTTHDGALHPSAVGLRMRVEVVNRSQRTWPGVTTDPAAGVRWYWYWERSGEGSQRLLERNRPIGLDLAPGESATTTLIGATPKPGTYDLIIGLRQGETEFPTTTRIEGLRVEASPARARDAGK